MRKKLLSASLAATLAVFSSTAAMGQSSVGDLPSRIELHGYAQAGWSWDDSNGTSTSSFNLKRTLLWAKARITDRWSFLFMHDFSSVPQEFYTDYRVTNGNSLSFRLGQFKHSYSMENPMSPTRLELIDVYSQAVLYLAGEGPDPLYGVNYGRDLGVMAFGDIRDGLLHYELALMNGQGINRKDGNSYKDFIGKLEIKPIKSLRVAASYQKGRGHAVGTALWNPGIQIGDDYRRDRWSVGGEWKHKWLSLRGEYLAGIDGEVKSAGFYLTGSARILKNFDAIASIDRYNRDTSSDTFKQDNWTCGLQYWFYEKCRLQLQYTRCAPAIGDGHNWIQAQVQVGF